MRSAKAPTSHKKPRRGRLKDVLLAAVATVSLSAAGLASAAYAAQSDQEQGDEQGATSQTEVTQDAGQQQEEGGTGTTDPEAQPPTPDPQRGTDQQGAAPQTPRRAITVGDNMDIAKQVNGMSLAQLVPNEEFTYYIQVSCSEVDCVNAKVSDLLADGLEGFIVESLDATTVAGNPAEGYGAIQWYNAANEPIAQPSVISMGDRFEVTYPNMPGLQESVQESIALNLRVPKTFSAERNGEVIPNTAYGTAEGRDKDGSAVDINPVESTARIQVNVEQNVSVAIGKTWEPSTQAFSEGAESTIKLVVENDSNVPVDTIRVLDPVAVPEEDGATELAEANPYRYVDFTGFGTTTLPDAADRVQVDAYVYVDGAWSWVNGAAASGFALPAGVDASQVGGLRYTFTSQGQKIKYGASYAAQIEMRVAQRATDRNDSSLDFSKKGYTASNVAQAQSSRTVDGTTLESPKVTDDAKLTVTPPKLETTVAKSFAPAKVSKGESSLGKLDVTNSGSSVQTWTVSDLDFFDGSKDGWVKNFDGFVSPVAYPDAATSGTVTYVFRDGGTQTVPFADGTVPGNPTTQPKANVTGFEFTFAADGNVIKGGAKVVTDFSVATNPAAAGFPANRELSFRNTATSRVTAQNGNTAQAPGSADLTVVDPHVALDTTKNVRPDRAVLPHQNLLIELNTIATPSVRTGVQQIIVEDSWKPADRTESPFWNVFDLTAIRPTQVPAGYTMQVFVQQGPGWNSIAANVPAGTFEMDEGAFAAAAGATQVTGIRFIYTATADNNEGRGTEGTVTVKPNLNFTAREEMRDDSPFPDGVASFDNWVYADTTAVPPVGPDVTDSDSDKGVGKLRTDPSDAGVGYEWIAKAWDRDWTLAQTRDIRTTNLYWSVGTGHQWVTLSDPANDQGDLSPAGTVFDAFNLTKVNAIGASNTALSNGWYLKWDVVSKVELYSQAASGWVEVPAPNGTWKTSNGGFKGYDLTDDQQRDTLGVRLTVQPDDAARQANVDAGANGDLLAPRPGTGVASGVGVAANNQARNFPLTWQLRDLSRSGDNGTEGWVTAEGQFNTGTKGEVLNRYQLRGDKGLSLNADDEILIIDPVANVRVTKDANPSQMVVPDRGSIDTANYPTGQFTVLAKNAASAAGAQNAASNAQYVRVVDPTPCTESDLSGCFVPNDPTGANSDPWNGGADATLDAAQAFNWLNITKLDIAASIPAQVNLANSVVWLLHYSGGTFTTTQTTAPAANELTAEQLADVIGWSVTFASAPSSGPAGGGGLITSANDLTVTIGTQLRDTKRLDGTATTLQPGAVVPVANDAYAQLIRPAGLAKDDRAQASDDAIVDLLGEKLSIEPVKIIDPEVINEPARHDDVSVKLSANQGTTSNASPWKVVIEDQDTEFWEFFDLRSLGQISAPSSITPAEDALVQVDAYVDGAWVTGAPSPITDAALPGAVAAGDVSGLRFTFTKAGAVDANGKTPLFSPVNAKDWGASIDLTVNLRDTERGSGQPIRIPRAAVENQIDAQSFGRNTDSLLQTAKDDVEFAAGSRELSIGKMANDDSRRVAAGTVIPWDIAVQNVGTGFLDLTTVVDDLPVYLNYIDQGRTEGSPGIVFTGLPDGVDEPAVSFTSPTDSSGGSVVFDWTGLKGRLAPRETVEIRLFLELQPGVQAGQRVVNNVTVNTEQTLENVFPFVFDGKQGDYRAELGEIGDDFGETWDYVEIVPNTAVQIFKGVIGSEPGAANPTNPDRNCRTFQGLDGKDYYRSPCAANSKQGGTDDWVLRIQNAGTTTDLDVVWVFDAFPTPGDTMIVGGGERGSQYRPVLTGMPHISLNDYFAGNDIMDSVTMQVTYDQGAVCEGVWSTLPAGTPSGSLESVLADPAQPCGGNDWVTVTSANEGDQEWEAVTGLRILYWDESDRYSFPAGGRVDITYSTRNVVKVDGDPVFGQGARNVIPVADEYAWNQFGATYIPNNGVPARLAPNRVGTHLMSGSVEVRKVVDADDSFNQFLPDVFTASMTCVTGDAAGPDGVPQQLRFAAGDSRDNSVLPIELRRNDQGGYDPVRVDGIPVGSVCTIGEDGEAGSFGEAARAVENASVLVAVPDVRDAEGVLTNGVPSSQITTLTNVYQWGNLSVTKLVTTRADVDKEVFGPFEFTLSCLAGDVPVQFPVGDDLATSLKFTLKDGETWQAPEGVIPAGSVCSLTESDSGDAGSTVITGDNVTDEGEGAASIVVRGTEAPTDVVSSLVTNGFAAGTLTVEKVVEGPGAAAYGSGLFGFNAVCTYNGSTLIDEDFVLAGGDTRTFGTYPVGTQCAITETATGGATHAAMDPEDGRVTVAGPGEGDESPVGNVAVTATNTFEVGALSIVKRVEGQGAAERGAGPFEALVECEYQAGEETVQVALPNGGLYQLSRDNGFEAHVEGIHAGASCKVTETKDGGADSTKMDPADGIVQIGANETTQVTITNVFGHLPKTGANVAIAAAGALVLLLGGGYLAMRGSKKRGAHAA